jgi:hypothetical protein
MINIWYNSIIIGAVTELIFLKIGICVKDIHQYELLSGKQVPEYSNSEPLNSSNNFRTAM